MTRPVYHCSECHAANLAAWADVRVSVMGHATRRLCLPCARALFPADPDEA